MFVGIYEVVQSGKEEKAVVVSSIKEKEKISKVSRKKLAKSISSENPATRIPRFFGSQFLAHLTDICLILAGLDTDDNPAFLLYF